MTAFIYGTYLNDKKEKWRNLGKMELRAKSQWVINKPAGREGQSLIKVAQYYKI